MEFRIVGRMIVEVMKLLRAAPPCESANDCGSCTAKDDGGNERNCNR